MTLAGWSVWKTTGHNVRFYLHSIVLQQELDRLYVDC